MDVQGPDGTTYSFPDSMSEQDVLGVMRKKFGGGGEAAPAPTPASPPEDTSPTRYPRLAAQALNSGLAAPINAGIAGLNLFDKYIGGPAANALAGPLPGGEESHLLSPIDPSRWGSGASQVTPTGPAENLLSGAAAGAASTLPFGAISRLATMGREGIKLGADILPELARMGREAFTYGAVPGASAAGVNEALSGTDPGTRQIADLATGAASAILAHRVLGTGDPYSAVAERLSPSTAGESASNVPVSVGRNIQDAIRRWRTGDPTIDPQTGATTYTPGSMPAMMEELKKPLSPAIADPKVTTDYNNFTSVLHSMSHEGGGSQQLMDEISPLLPKQLLSQLGSMAAQGGGITALTPSGQSVLLGATRLVSEAMAIRSRIGDMMSNPSLMPKGVDATQLDRIYKALSSDIGQTFQGQGLGGEWNQYNKGTSAMYNAGRNTFSKLASSDNEAQEKIDPAAAAAKLAGPKATSDLQALRTHIPEAADEEASGFLRTSPGKWAKLSDDAKAARVPSPWDRHALDNASAAPTSPIDRLRHTVEPGTGAAVGYFGAEGLNELASHLAANSLESLHSAAFVNPGMAALAGAAAPALYHFGKGIVQNPSALGIPIRGGIAGAAVDENEQPNPLSR